jgi:A/G-specific adenine glycosylase
MSIQIIRQELPKWYANNKRDLPWRNTTNPYYIWLSEVILQQTQVVQGIDYYNKFVSVFPSINDLKNASIDTVLKHWQGLGYYSRARNLHKAAHQIAQLNEFPNSFNELIKLKGVGEYTAAAIASIAFNEPVSVVDGNVYRVLSRYFDVNTAIDSTTGKKEFKALAEEILNRSNPSQWNQAMMEFGALQCTPKKPNCEQCPLNTSCLARINGTVLNLPFKKGKTKVQKVYSDYFEISTQNGTIFYKRPLEGIWGGLYELPVVSNPKEQTAESSMIKVLNLISKDAKAERLELAFSCTHILSHRKILARFYKLKITDIKELKSPFVFEKNIPSLPIPRLIERYFDFSTAQ